MLYGALLAFLLMQPMVDNLARKWKLKTGSPGIQSQQQTDGKRAKE